MNDRSFFEFACEGYSSGMRDFRSLEGRLCCAKILLKKIFFLPFTLFAKAVLTVFRAVGLLLSIFLLVVSFGVSESIRELFCRRVLFLAKDLADWILFPFAVILGLLKLVLASTLHPAVYFH